ncbi:glycoside hydrolase family 24 protein [Massilia sp. TN1-12]|uniref:glycoside hydrolase family 24 protein n=1 Tax=Massilia paldalensis TaxID=3377675 RepID=UPI00384EB88B
MPATTGLHPNLAAFLDMIAVSEIGSLLLVKSDNGYNVCVGSTPAQPILFSSYAQHPRRRSEAQNSDAAGRYQFMGRYWDHYRAKLGLKDFGPVSQDKWCIQLIRECKALDAIEAGRFDEAVRLCRSRWASLPGAGYGQRENKLTDLAAVYRKKGGVVA